MPMPLPSSIARGWRCAHCLGAVRSARKRAIAWPDSQRVVPFVLPSLDCARVNRELRKGYLRAPICLVSWAGRMFIGGAYTTAASCLNSSLEFLVLLISFFPNARYEGSLQQIQPTQARRTSEAERIRKSANSSSPTGMYCPLPS